MFWPGLARTMLFLWVLVSGSSGRLQDLLFGEAVELQGVPSLSFDSGGVGAITDQAGKAVSVAGWFAQEVTLHADGGADLTAKAIGAVTHLGGPCLEA